MKLKATLLRPLLTAALLLLPALARAQSQVPANISYQGYVTDIGGTPVGNTTAENHQVIFRIWDAATGGTLIYSETQLVTISKGEFSVLVGAGTAVTGEEAKGKPTVLVSNAFTGSSRYLGLTVAAATGANGINPATDLEISPRQQMVSTAFTFRAKEAETVVANSIGTSNIANTSVTLAKMAANAVNSGSIVDSSIALTDLAANSVDSSKIVDGSIVNADIATGAAIVDTKLATISTTGKVADSALSSNVALLNRGTQNFTGATNSFNGSVGIGVATPQTKLHVNGGDLTVSVGGNTADVGGGINFGASDFSTLSPMSKVQGLLANAAGTELQGGLGFFTRQAGAGGQSLTEKVRIRDDGSVGIGTKGPEAPLHLVHPSRSANQWGILLDNASNVTNRGGIRVGNTGFFEFTNDARNANPNYARLNAVGAWEQVSDVRRKKDITSLTGLLQGALNLRPVRYHFKDAAPGDPLQIGFIAQEVREQFPSLVTDGGDLSLNYSGLSVVAIGAIKELHEVVRKQDVELASIKTRLTELEQQAARVTAMERDVADFKKMAAKAPPQTHASVEAKDARISILEQQLAQQAKDLAALKVKDEARDAKVAAIEAMLSANPPATRSVSLKKSTGRVE